MRFMHANAGMSLVEVMVAVVILTVGLSGVAGMQLKALQENNFAGTLSTGVNADLAWLEWFTDFVSQPDQDNILFDGKLCRQNYARIAMLDTNTADRGFTERQIPSTTADLLSAFQNTYHFRNADGSNFTAEQVPQPPPSGSYILWRIAANVPAPNLTTLEVSCIYATAFVRSRGPTLRLVVFSNI